MKVHASIIDTHKHSPGDAEQCEEYPIHLRDVLAAFDKLMKQPADTATPTVSAENYTMQDSVVGIPRPIGSKPNSASRFSTRDANLKMGLPLVERFKTGSAYVSDKACDDVSPATSSTKMNKRKSKKVDVRDILTNQNKSRDDMRKAIVDLTGSVRNKGLSNDELMFKKEIWLDRKEYLNKKLKAKYSPRELQIRLEVDRAKMDMIKSDRNLALERMGKTDDNDLKDLHKKEYVTLSGLYSTMLNRLVNPSSTNNDSQLKSPNSSSISDNLEHDDEFLGSNVIRPRSAD